MRSLARFGGMRRFTVICLLVGCERADGQPEAPTLVGPDTPEVPAMRAASTASDAPAPRAAPLAPDLVGLPHAEKRWFLALTPEQRHGVRTFCRAQRSDPCLGLLPKPRHETPGHALNSFCFIANGRRNGCNTPLVLAFDAQPIVFATSPGRFAFEPGHAVASDWPTAETPWLALDRDGDGAITSGAELFGDATGDARNGFEALAALDANRDGVIDHDDPAFARLVLWADTNGDRRSTRGELRPASEVITAIPLAHDIDRRCVRGSCEGERGSFTWRDGDHIRTGAVVDIYLRNTL